MPVKIEILTDLDRMIAAFERLERLAAPEVANALDAIVHATFEETEAMVPVDAGDKRRPAGSLKASGQVFTTMPTDDYWTGEISYGTEDAAGVPYAQWTLEKDRKRGEYFMGPTYAAEEAITRVIEQGFEP